MIRQMNRLARRVDFGKRRLRIESSSRYLRIDMVASDISFPHSVQITDSDDIETVISAIERGVITPVRPLTYHQAELRRRVGLIEDGHLVVWIGKRFDDGGDWGYQSAWPLKEFFCMLTVLRQVALS
jgi:hypothetical protein